LLHSKAGYDTIRALFTKKEQENEMVKLRMRRTGCKNHAAYRIVAADERSPRDGKFLEILGWYDTAIKDENFKIDLARVDDWLKRGAKPSTTVASLIRRARKAAAKA
jgi:small subunit ribosomal protein S16